MLSGPSYNTCWARKGEFVYQTGYKTELLFSFFLERGLGPQIEEVASGSSEFHTTGLVQTSVNHSD